MKSGEIPLLSRGITLVELMILSAIIAILAMIIGQHTFNINNETQRISVQQNLRSLEGALNVYYHDMGAFPTEEEGLRALLEPLDEKVTADWAGPYIAHHLTIDPWGEPYRYQVSEEVYQLSTLGADRRIGGVGLDEDIIITRPLKRE